jgi:hypothetical protein
MKKDKGNTLNICLGHQSFPSDFHQYVDLMIAPRMIRGPGHVVVIDDSYFGEHGGSLSEYAQLLWLYDNFDNILGTYDYVRIFQYRRFVAKEKIGQPSSNEGALWIPKEELRNCSKEFCRTSTAELFNNMFSKNVVGQYASVHLIEDIINFSKFLFETGILDSKQTVSFLTGSVIIYACNMGTFRSTTLREVLKTLRDAAEFRKTCYFIPRVGYQRRVVGFLLERLNSYLILNRIQSGLSDGNFGHHIIVSDGPLIGRTEGPITELSDGPLIGRTEGLITELSDGPLIGRTEGPITERNAPWMELRDGAKRFLRTHLPERTKRFLKTHFAKSD